MIVIPGLCSHIYKHIHTQKNVSHWNGTLDCNRDHYYCAIRLLMLVIISYTCLYFCPFLYLIIIIFNNYCFSLTIVCIHIMHSSYPFPTIFSLITISSLPPRKSFDFFFFNEPLSLTRAVCVALGFKLSIRVFWAYPEYTSEVNDCLSPLLINSSPGSGVTQGISSLWWTDHRPRPKKGN